VTQRQAVAKGRAKLAAKQADPAASNRSKAAQKGALTKANNKLAAAKQSGRRRIQAAPRSGVIRPGRRSNPASGAANGIRPISARLQTSRQIGLSPKQYLAQEERNGAKYASKQPKPKPRQRPAAGPPRNGRVPYEPQTAGGLADAVARSARRRGGKPANSIKPYKPATASGRDAAGNRGWARTAGELSKNYKAIKDFKSRAEGITRKWARRTARDIADAGGKGARASVARTMLSVTDSRTMRAARGVIRGRAARAAAAAARGSKPAAKAQAIYDRQLAPVLPKGKGKGKNSLRPGPRNTKGAPPKRRRKRPKG
jgi:hypothetical protein